MARSTQAQAAALVRKTLKAAGLDVRVTSEAASMMTAMRVELRGDVLPATRKEVETYCKQFQYGHFDGMVDMYEYSNNRDDIPQVKYVTVDTVYSDEIRQEVYEYLCENFADFADLSGSYRDNANMSTRSGEWVSTYVHRVLE
jgi:hypothetical protein